MLNMMESLTSHQFIVFVKIGSVKHKQKLKIIKSTSFLYLIEFSNYFSIV